MRCGDVHEPAEMMHDRRVHYLNVEDGRGGALDDLAQARRHVVVHHAACATHEQAHVGGQEEPGLGLHNVSAWVRCYHGVHRHAQTQQQVHTAPQSTNNRGDTSRLAPSTVIEASTYHHRSLHRSGRTRASPPAQ